MNETLLLINLPAESFRALDLKVGAPLSLM